MNTFLNDVRDTIVPGHDPRHGPLPPLLLIMTVVAALVDSFSFLTLGHVFVANSTGNILFIGFALAHVPGFSISESLLALFAFIIGAGVGGLIGSRFKSHRGRMFSAASSFQSGLLLVAVVLTLLAASPVQTGYRDFLVVVLAIAMGLQNAVARKLAVPDLTTTVLTLTITGLGSDNKFVGGTGSKAGRRLVSIGSMLVGAVLGAVLVLHAPLYWPLVVALVCVAFVAISSARTGRVDGEWARA
ncbi:MAG: YoaK family protein [Acidimicrobiales bacterium]